MQKRTSAIIIIAGLVGLIAIVAIERGKEAIQDIAPGVMNPGIPSQPSTEQGWETYGRGVDRREYWFQKSAQGRVILYRFDQKAFKARLVHRVPPLTVREWLASDARDTLVVNGVYFDEGDLPVGYTVIDGNRVGKGMVSGKTTTMVGLSPSVAMSVDRPTAKDGFQTYPVLVKNGVAAVATDSKQYARRTFIGTDKNENVYVGVVADSAISLYELSQVLASMDVAWDTVANLDGGPSTGLASRMGDKGEYFDSMTLVPNVLMLERR